MYPQIYPLASGAWGVFHQLSQNFNQSADGLQEEPFPGAGGRGQGGALVRLPQRIWRRRRMFDGALARLSLVRIGVSSGPSDAKSYRDGIPPS